jgi:twitching motility two-component system response regulator PilH
MDTSAPLDRIAKDIEAVLRRIGQHRSMLAQMALAQSQALAELRALLVRSGGASAGGLTVSDVDEDILATTLLGDLARGRAGRPAQPTPKVLLVDDDPTTRNLISHFLRKEEFLVEKASGGHDGLAKARGGRPDLVIVDAAVPGMDGFEFLTLLRRDPETAGLPVLMLSSIDEEEAVVKSLAEGADYIVKPFSPRILLAKVKKTLKDARRHAFDHRPL